MGLLAELRVHAINQSVVDGGVEMAKKTPCH